MRLLLAGFLPTFIVGLKAITKIATINFVNTRARIKTMKYQLLQHLKTKTKVLEIYDTLAECKSFAKQDGVKFEGLSYVGNFPTFSDNSGKFYSIQGLAEGLNIVCSLPKGEAESFQ